MTAPKRTPALLDLVTDPSTGRLSHSRLWSNVGSLAAVVVFVKVGWTGQLSAEVWAFFLAGVCGHAAVSKALSLKYRQPQQPDYGYDERPLPGGDLPPSQEPR
jgi:hypothetical protein